MPPLSPASLSLTIPCYFVISRFIFSCACRRFFQIRGEKRTTVGSRVVAYGIQQLLIENLNLLID